MSLRVGDILEHTDGPRKGRQVIIAMCLDERYPRCAVRSVTTGRLSYVQVSVLQSKRYRFISRAPEKGPTP